MKSIVESELDLIKEKICNLNRAIKTADIDEYRKDLNDALKGIFDNLRQLSTKDTIDLLEGLNSLSSKIEDVDYKPDYDIYINNMVTRVIRGLLDNVIDGVSIGIKFFQDYDSKIVDMGISIKEFYGVDGEKIRERDKQRVSNMESAVEGLLKQKESAEWRGRTIDELVEQVRDNINLESLKYSRSSDNYIINLYEKQRKEVVIENRIKMRSLDQIARLRDIQRGEKYYAPRREKYCVQKETANKDDKCIIS